MFVNGPYPELDHMDMVQVAKHKVDFALDPENPENKRETFISGPSNLIIAADVRTRPLVLHGSDRNQRLVPDRPATAVSLGKPESLENIRRTLLRMDRATEKGKKDGYYVIEAGTYIRGHKTRNGIPDSVTAVLDTRMIEYFSTPSGFTEYVDGFYRFYQAEAYAQSMGSTTHAIPKITDVAGGLSLGTLLSLGAIKSLNGIERNDSRFGFAVKSSLSKALFGFNAGVMKKITPDIQKFIDAYPLLQISTDLALASRKV